VKNHLPSWLSIFAPLFGPVVLTVAGCGASSAATQTDDAHEGAIVGQKIPDLRLGALNGGKEVRVNDLRGKVVLLDVWASWCAPCKEELPLLDDMSSRLEGKGIQILAVSIDENREDAEAFLRLRPSWSIMLARDPAGKALDRLHPPKMPSSFVIDREGVIRAVNAGFSRDDVQKIESRLVALADKLSSEPIASPSPSADTPTATDSPAKSAAQAVPAPPPAATATATGLIDGRPFAPKLARVAGRMQKDGRILLSLSERSECTPSSGAKPGDATLTIMVPWKDGSKTDLASLKQSTRKSPGAIRFTRLNAARKSEASKTFKPSGTVTIASAPTDLNGIGKMTIDLTSGDYRLTGDLDIQVCVPPR
jgi:cytochrome c biogenesis protein CcmG/thiol:disulfide interchange protein DsbE